MKHTDVCRTLNFLTKFLLYIHNSNTQGTKNNTMNIKVTKTNFYALNYFEGQPIT